MCVHELGHGRAGLTDLIGNNSQHQAGQTWCVMSRIHIGYYPERPEPNRYRYERGYEYFCNKCVTNITNVTW